MIRYNHVGAITFVGMFWSHKSFGAFVDNTITFLLLMISLGHFWTFTRRQCFFFFPSPLSILHLYLIA